MRHLEVKGTLVVCAGRAAPRGSWVLTISGRLLSAFYPHPEVDPEPRPFLEVVHTPHSLAPDQLCSRLPHPPWSSG